MTVEMLKGKIHRATVVQAELDYVGSITVDEDLLEAAGIMVVMAWIILRKFTCTIRLSTLTN